MGGLRQSFAWAIDGLGYVLRTQRNMKIHLVMAGLAVLGGVVLKITRMEWGLLTLTITLVLTAEAVNTALEKTVDLVTSEYHPLARTAKNTAAGAVLLTALNAVIMGFIIFYPHLIKWMTGD